MILSCFLVFPSKSEQRRCVYVCTTLVTTNLQIFNEQFYIECFSRKKSIYIHYSIFPLKINQEHLQNR